MTAAPPALRVRPVRPEDEPFLWQMLTTTANLPPEEPPTVERVQADPGIASYVAGWGRAGDTGIVGEVDEGPIGAAWYRTYAPDGPGYGFVDMAVPEISIGVEAAWRRRGVGRALLEALIDAARAEGHEALSLSVDQRNAPALALYRSIGFREVGGSVGNPTMLLRLVG